MITPLVSTPVFIRASFSETTATHTLYTLVRKSIYPADEIRGLNTNRWFALIKCDRLCRSPLIALFNDSGRTVMHAAMLARWVCEVIHKRGKTSDTSTDSSFRHKLYWLRRVRFPRFFFPCPFHLSTKDLERYNVVFFFCFFSNIIGADAAVSFIRVFVKIHAA